MHKSRDDHEIADGHCLDCCKVPGRCSFYKWLADYRNVLVAGKELQLIGDHHCGGVCSSLQVAGDMKIRSTISWVDERKIDKLINLVTILVVISVVIVIAVFFGVIALLVKL
ncbi:unnamed protein product [Urochloa decumbens]|uniref:Uncharacterized protein n=1 Tax=Urochloa decumbens TaxID=240449 RepID=A0ABC9ASS0_9POAL